MTKTRKTDERTYDKYTEIVKFDLQNPYCQLGHGLEVRDRFVNHLDNEGFEQKKYNGSYIQCKCPAKHECFTLSHNKGTYRISSHVPDYVAPPIMVKRRRVNGS